MFAPINSAFSCNVFAVSPFLTILSHFVKSNVLMTYK